MNCAPRSTTLLSTLRPISGVLLLACLTSQAASQQLGRGITPIYDLQGGLIGTTANIASALGGTFASAGAAPTVNVQFSPGTTRVHVTIPNTGTAWAEEFLAFIPIGPTPPASSPLLVLFHGAGQQPTNSVSAISVEDLAAPMITDAINRGWHVLIPLGGHAFNFGHPDAQTNTQLSMEVFMEMFGTSIDIARVYGYGHSMGGGWMMAQAALRSGVDDLRFAALFANAGTPSTAFTYGVALNHSVLDIIFGGSPSTDAYIYSRSSMADVSSQFPFPVDTSTSTCLNLKGTPIDAWTCRWDKLQFRIAAFSVHGFLDSLDSPNHLAVPNCAAPYHHWHNPDNIGVLDWMGNKTLSDPDPSEAHSILADRDAQFHYFHLIQEVAGQFSRLSYQLFTSIPNDKLVLASPENLEQISFSASRVGITTTPNFEVLINSNGAAAPDVLVSDISTPSSVERFDGSAWITAPFLNLRTGGILLDGAGNPPPQGQAVALWRITQ